MLLSTAIASLVLILLEIYKTKRKSHTIAIPKRRECAIVTYETIDSITSNDSSDDEELPKENAGKPTKNASDQQYCNNTILKGNYCIHWID